jgi:hypothetical protein
MRPPTSEEAVARSRLAHAGLARLEEPAELEVVPDVVLDRLRRSLSARLDDARDRLAGNFSVKILRVEVRGAWRGSVSHQGGLCRQCADQGRASAARSSLSFRTCWASALAKQLHAARAKGARNA